MANWEKFYADREARGNAIREEFRKRCGMTKTEELLDTLDYAIEALKKIAKAMKDTDYENYDFCEECGRKGMTPGEAGKTSAYVAKVVDEIFRLMKFAMGEADHRTEVGLADLLKVLSNEQFQQVSRWIEEGQQKTLQ